jgi:hypothetical protein
MARSAIGSWIVWFVIAVFGTVPGDTVCMKALR